MVPIFPEGAELTMDAISKRRNSSLSLKRSPKDDWSKIEDRKQRRTVQNRLCQRAFRQRKAVSTQAKGQTNSLKLRQPNSSKEVRQRLYSPRMEFLSH